MTGISPVQFTPCSGNAPRTILVYRYNGNQSSQLSLSTLPGPGSGAEIVAAQTRRSTRQEPRYSGATVENRACTNRVFELALVAMKQWPQISLE